MQFTGNRYIVGGVTLLIAYIAITSQVFVFIPWLWSISVKRALQVLVPFNLGVVFIYWNYYLACTTEPGSPPPGWGAPETVEGTGSSDAKELTERPDSARKQDSASSAATATTEGHSTALDHKDSHHHRKLQQQEHNASPNSQLGKAQTTGLLSRKKKTPLPRFCRTCEAFKPPRSHHCRICKKCVLKMDHHCPWINNCVGHFNYGHFIRFISWVSLTTGACMVLLLWRIVDVMQNEVYYMYSGTGPTKTQIVFMAINIAVDGGVLLAVGVLTIYHLWSMVSNTSTIEVWEQEKVEAMIKKGKLRKTKFPYDVGCFRNYQAVLGSRIHLWLFPQPALGNGTEFDVMDDKDAALIWPPREYQTSKKQERTFVSDYTSSSIRQRHNRNLSSSGVPLSPGSVNGAKERSNSKGRSVGGGATAARGPAQFPTHVRRGSEGWIVQDLTVQQRADLYDKQMQYQREHQNDEGAEVGNEEDDYQEGLSDIEGNTYGGLPGGMQSSGGYEDYNDGNAYDVAEEGERFQLQQQNQQEPSSEEDDDIPYDVISDEYDDDGYNHGEYDDDEEEYHGDDDDMDEHNPYLAYNEDEEDKDEGVAADPDDEVTLNGRNRHKIGRFFESAKPNGQESDKEIDEWDEGEGVDIGCRPPGKLGALNGPASTLEYDPKKKTFYTLMVEREEALKKAASVAGTGKK